MASLKPPSYSNTTRPPANSVQPGFMIWNTDEVAPQVSDGTHWRDMRGNIT
jgi:hypothetical protein